MIVKSYSITTSLPSGLNIDKLNLEISDSGNVTNFSSIQVFGDTLSIKGESLNNESGLDSVISAHIPETQLETIMKGSGDYKYKRNLIIINVATRGFSNISGSEKILASENFAVSKANRDTIHSISEQVVNGIKFHEQSIAARVRRREAAEAEVYNRLQNGSERLDLMNDVTTLLDTYQKFGIEGTVEGDTEGLFDYLESRVGTSFENTGLLSKTYIVEAMTVSQLSTRLMDIFKNGNY